MTIFDKSLVVAWSLVGLALSTGCAGFAFSGHGVNQGLLYADSDSNEKVTDNGIATKTGEACASSILGWVTTGDASVATAARSAGIQKVAAVDHHFTNIVGVYAEYCVRVNGE